MTAASCGRARRLAWGGPGEVVLSVERARAKAHIARCPACQRFVVAMRLFGQALGSARSSEPAPLTLRLRIRDTLEEARQEEAKRHGWGRLALGLAATVTLALGAQLLPLKEPDPVARIARSERMLLTQSGIESSDARVVHQWLAQQVPYDVHVPEFFDARLTGAAVATIDGRRTAVLRFQVGDRHIAYVIAPRESAIADSTLRARQVRKLAIVSWQMPGLLHVWMGPIPAEHLASLARRCAEQARTAAAVSGTFFTTPPRA